jgi:hypothetical protein
MSCIPKNKNITVRIYKGNNDKKDQLDRISTSILYLRTTFSDSTHASRMIVLPTQPHDHTDTFLSLESFEKPKGFMSQHLHRVLMSSPKTL